MIMHGAIQQTWALLLVRRNEFRGPARRTLHRALLAAVVLLMVLPLLGAATAQNDSAAIPVGKFLPALWMLFATSTVISMLLNGPGRTLISRSEAQVFLVTPAADHLGALLLSPLNTSWTLQVLALTLSTGVVTGLGPGLVFSLVTTWAFIIACTVTAQALGWFSAVLISYRHGQSARRITMAVVVLATLWIAHSPRLQDLMSNLPTQRLILHIVSVTKHAPSVQAWQDLLVLLLWSVALMFVGARTAAWWHRRPEGIQRRRDTTRARRRSDPATELAAHLAIDRNSIWRSAPLRRGAFVLAGLPAIGGALAPMSWPFLDLLPGMVTSGLALLFGVNLWALDGTGALWRASLPSRPRHSLAGRVQVLVELAAAGCLLALTPALLMTVDIPTAADVVALIGVSITSVAFVVGRCTWWSVSHPYAAPLQEARDQPAPPAAMAWYATRMAVASTAWGIGFSLAARLSSIPMALGLTAAGLFLAAYDMTRAVSLWADDTHRLAVLAVITGQSGALPSKDLPVSPAVTQRWHRVTSEGIRVRSDGS